MCVYEIASNSCHEIIGSYYSLILFKLQTLLLGKVWDNNAELIIGFPTPEHSTSVSSVRGGQVLVQVLSALSSSNIQSITRPCLICLQLSLQLDPFC